jgi:hypothetical protein
MRFATIFICSTILNDDDTINKRKLLRDFSTSTRFHVFFCLIDTKFISNVNVMKIDMWFNDWLRSERVSQLITFFTNQLILNTRFIVLFKCYASQMIMLVDNVNCIRVCKTTFMSWLVASCWVDFNIFFFTLNDEDWNRLTKCVFFSFINLLFIVFKTIKIILNV